MDLDTDLTPESMISLLNNKKQLCCNLIQMEQSKISRIEAYIKMFAEEVNPMQNQVVLKETPVFKVASLRNTVANYGAQGSLWNETNLGYGHLISPFLI